VNSDQATRKPRHHCQDNRIAVAVRVNKHLTSMSDTTEEKSAQEALSQNVRIFIFLFHHSLWSITDDTDKRARQRKNQQNSRKRKQSYLEDLEQRWSSCVRTGAQASTEMQREARRVDGENVVLRAMLRELGVLDSVVEARLIDAEHYSTGRLASMVVNV